MYVTASGKRMLIGAEADLVRGVIGIMVDSIVAESRGDETAWRYGIAWFDAWDTDGRLWLLERITKSFFTPFDPPPRAAIFEATADAVFAELRSLVHWEINDPSAAELNAQESKQRSWRQSVIDGYRSQHSHDPKIAVDSVDIDAWSRVVAVIGDTITGPLSYQDAESYRDGDPQQCRRYLESKGLPDDFLEMIPPVQTVDQTQLSIDRIQGIVFRTP